MPPSFDTSFLVDRLGSVLCVCEIEQYEGADLDAAEDSGFFSDDNITNATEIHLVGQSEPGATVAYTEAIWTPLTE